MKTARGRRRHIKKRKQTRKGGDRHSKIRNIFAAAAAPTDNSLTVTVPTAAPIKKYTKNNIKRFSYESAASITNNGRTSPVQHMAEYVNSGTKGAYKYAVSM
jgi:hypothetical protein